MKPSAVRALQRTMLGILVAIGLLADRTAFAQTGASPRVYAVMSWIGDSLFVSPYLDATASGNRVVAKGLDGWDSHSLRTGSHLSPQQDLAAPVKDTLYDDTTAGAIAAGVKQRDPGAVVETLSARNSAFYGLQDRLFDNANAAREGREALKAMLRERKASYLIVVTKRRSNVEMLGDSRVFADAQLRLLTGSSGDVLRLEGIGFYVDDAVQVQSLKTLDRSTGVLASFVNITVRLVDARTLDVVREQTASKSKIIAISKPLEAGFSAWDEATEAQKSESLRELIQTTMAEVTPPLLGARVP
jgi:hypothetical protein